MCLVLLLIKISNAWYLHQPQHKCAFCAGHTGGKTLLTAKNVNGQSLSYVDITFKAPGIKIFFFTIYMYGNTVKIAKIQLLLFPHFQTIQFTVKRELF